LAGSNYDAQYTPKGQSEHLSAKPKREVYAHDVHEVLDASEARVLSKTLEYFKQVLP